MIGVMDSGLGGLLLLESIHKSHPDTDVLFYGDIEHMPYGDKSDEELVKDYVAHLTDSEAVSLHKKITYGKLNYI